ncbi:hypothetical protein LINPERHAP1_LOCUS25766, partial [Linum perenne]
MDSVKSSREHSSIREAHAKDGISYDMNVPRTTYAKPWMQEITGAPRSPCSTNINNNNKKKTLLSQITADGIGYIHQI